MGIFPIRLISPNLTEDFATETATSRFPVGHDALTGRNYGDTYSTLDAWQLRSSAVDAVTRLGDPLDAFDSRAATVSIAKDKQELLVSTVRDLLIPIDETLCDENLCDSYL